VELQGEARVLPEVQYEKEMIEFLSSLGMMVAGAVFRILWRAVKHAGSQFELKIFFGDNVIRWAVLLAMITIANLIIYFQPDAVQAIQNFGIPLSALALGSAGIGFALGEGVVRTIPTVHRVLNGSGGQ